MSDQGNNSIAGRLRRAAELHLRLKDECSREALRELLVWLRSSQLNIDAYIQICHQDEAVTRAMVSHEALSRDTVRQDRENVVTHVNWWKGSSVKVDESPRRPRFVRWRAWVTTAAAILVTVYLAISETSTESSQNGLGIETSADLIATSVDSSPKTKRLSDGTKVTLEAGAALRVGFTDVRREVRLYEGKATFAVAEDTKKPERPFVVNTHVGRVSAVGTKYMVAVDTAGMDVLVYEGEVQISRRNKPGAVITRKAGEPTYRVPIDSLSAVAANGAGGLEMWDPSG